jgi:hypothetical protein
MNLKDDVMRRVLVAWREAQHWVGWHQWQTLQPEGATRSWERCTWCGANRT